MALVTGREHCCVHASVADLFDANGEGHRPFPGVDLRRSGRVWPKAFVRRDITERCKPAVESAGGPTGVPCAIRFISFRIAFQLEVEACIR